MSLNASCVHKNVPVRLVSTTDFHSSQVRSSSKVEGAVVPALLNNRSSRPKTCSACVNKSRTDEGSRTSVGTTKVWLELVWEALAEQDKVKRNDMLQNAALFLKEGNQRLPV